MDKELALDISNLGKMYKLYKKPKDKILDAFGIKRWKKDYFREFWALRDVNIKINKGERVGFIGHNGAGKSTLLKIIVGNISQTEGSMKVDGRIQALLEIGTGFHPEFTGRENIYASLVYQGKMNKDEMRLKEEEIIEFTELGEYIDQPVRTYSAGMYARLAFATATAVCPEILIIDEVLGVGDAYFNGKCVERMQKLTRDEGATVLFVSHDLQSIQSLCDRVIWIDKGRIRYDGETLKGVKLYAQSVRKNEETRLMLRDLKHTNNQSTILERKEDIINKYQFRFISNEDEMKPICKIYDIRLYAGNKVIGGMMVGSPMDNDRNGENYIIEEHGGSCWGTSKKSNRGFYREYSNLPGSNYQAEFCMSLSKLFEGKEIGIGVTMERMGDSDLNLEVYDPVSQCYKLIAKNQELEREGIRIFSNLLDSTDNETNFNEDTLEDSNAVLIDRIETNEARICNIKIIDGYGLEAKVIPFERNIQLIQYEVCFKELYQHFFIGFSVYSDRGDVVLTSADEIWLAEKRRNLKLEYSLQRCKFGPGEYYISIGIYENFNPIDASREQKFLALIDRAVSFKIEKATNYHFGLGNIVPEIEIKLLDEDETMLKKFSLINDIVQ